MSLNNSIFIKWNDEPLLINNEKIVITSNGTAMLNQIPDEFYKVTMVDSNLVEIKQQNPIVNANQFKCNYRTGQLTFDSSRIGQNITVSRYLGLGVVYYSADRIYDSSNGVPVDTNSIKTLQDYINSVKPYGYQDDFNINTMYQPDSMVSYDHTLYRCKQLSQGILPTNTTYWQSMISVKTEATYSTSQGDYAKSQGDYAKTEGDFALAQGNYAKSKADSFNNVTTSATNGNIKINNVETTIYTHPSSHLPSIITQDANNRFTTDAEKSTWNAKASTSTATTSANGLMSSTDKTKLDKISATQNINLDNVVLKTQDAYTQPTLLNSWVDYGGTDAITSYFKDQLGIVRIIGMVKNGTSATSPMFILPVGYRPLKNLLFPVVTSTGTGSVYIKTDGTVVGYNGINTSWTSLAGIHFKAEQ